MWDFVAPGAPHRGLLRERPMQLGFLLPTELRSGSLQSWQHTRVDCQSSANRGPFEAFLRPVRSGFELFLRPV